MQFVWNMDYPGFVPPTAEAEDEHHHQQQQPPMEALDPDEFPPVHPVRCARIRNRVYHPVRNQVVMVEDLLIRTAPPPSSHSGRRPSARRPRPSQQQDTGSDDDSSDSSSSSSDSSMSIADDDNNNTNGNGVVNNADPFGRQQDDLHEEEEEEERAYWIQRTIRDAIYGRVLFALVLKRCTSSSSPNIPPNVDWEVTSQFCAVKEMSWQHIRRERDRLAEDPIKEVAAMQYLKQWHRRQQRGSSSENAVAAAPAIQPNNKSSSSTNRVDGVAKSFFAISETNIMMPLDLLSDDRHLYSVMPYCDGGELFERLDMNERFTEQEARYWMLQILNGLENLQNAGICHRDMSLENLLVHNKSALIIDMGMCLRVPFMDNNHNNDNNNNPNSRQQNNGGQSSSNNNNHDHHPLNAALNEMIINGGLAPPGSAAVQQSSPIQLDQPLISIRSRPRALIRPQGTCGKWIYMSPEIYKNREPFDGYAVDMWAAGVILFLMLTGFPPWERACQTDERFKYMTAGYLVDMLREWEMGLSEDAMDLLQRMLFLDPRSRLSLQQVRQHPWMNNF